MKVESTTSQREPTREDYIKMGGHYGNLFMLIAKEKELREEEERRKVPEIIRSKYGNHRNGP